MPPNPTPGVEELESLLKSCSTTCPSDGSSDSSSLDKINAGDEELMPKMTKSAKVYGATTTDAKPPKKVKVVNVEKEQFLRRTQTSFIDDAVNFREGTIPQSMIVATVIGIVCGLSAYLYYEVLEGLLKLLWDTLPQKFVVGIWPESTYVLWIPLMGFTMAICVGLSVVFTGEPGDLAYTVKCVHDKAYIGMDHVSPMVLASLFSICGGGSLGPEAPLVAICAALGGFVSRRVFHQTNRNVIRKHTLMGMAGALAAFFGCPLGGSLFALEINSRFGVEYFEHVVEAIFCGEVTLVTFRAAAGLSIEKIWQFDVVLDGAEPKIVMIGAVIGVLGAGIAAVFAMFHWKVVDMFHRFGLLDNKYAVQRALVGAVVIVSMGMLVPYTMFWGEDEFQQVASMAPAKELDHIFPTSGLLNFEMTSCFSAFTVGICKLIAISFTVAGGYRGGFIFPFFTAGAAFGRALCFLFPSIPVPVACLCFAAGINVAITRTSLGTTLILAFLSGEPNTTSSILFASLASLFVTAYMPFIKSQIIRSDIDDSLYLAEDDHKKWEANRHHRHEEHAESHVKEGMQIEV
eukprot:CAMPEP_0172479874 /NCGR_PEP_ID=MMETSP1066-20121228/4681_1 /TAXON_ID=671091 /ORGANISM="Coscinodiscus wailesii, Strain CCMP2513" /LENGTH=572 /DNA_ID=CAMNT_0013240693 /DNA_START=61 /DNA_END=1779 /DNA_ORIENTATION=+